MIVSSVTSRRDRCTYCVLGERTAVARKELLVDREQQRLVVGERPREVEHECLRRSPSAAEAYSAGAMSLSPSPWLSPPPSPPFWNILLARARDTECATAVALLAAVIVFAPVTALRFDAEWAVWPFIVVTSLLQLLYFALLAHRLPQGGALVRLPGRPRGGARDRARRLGARARPRHFGEPRSPACSSSAPGVLLVRGLKTPPDPHALWFALGDRRVIAAYTLLDKRGITHASPVTYLELSMIPAALGYARARRVKGRAANAGRARTPRRFSPAARRSPPTRWFWRRSSVRPPRRWPRCGRRAS